MNGTTLDPRLGVLGIKTATVVSLLVGYIPPGRGEGVRAAALLDIIREAVSPAYKADVPRINAPRAAGDYLMKRFVGMTEEVFGILCLNSKGDLLADSIVGKGTCSSVAISPREVYREALRHGAVSIIVYHNHPSGDPSPSSADTVLTKRLRESGHALGVSLADHIIVGKEAFHSFRAAQCWDNEGR